MWIKTQEKQLLNLSHIQSIRSATIGANNATVIAVTIQGKQISVFQGDTANCDILMQHLESLLKADDAVAYSEPLTII